MQNYQAPLDEMRFVIEHWLDARQDWERMPAFAEVDYPLTAQVLAEAARFAEERLAPLNAPGDRHGCRYEAGQVFAPNGFADAYQAYVEAGWPSLACAAESGGQGLPQLLNVSLLEMLYAANHAWAMYPGIAHGAYECLRQFANDELKAKYLPGLVDGTCLPTMCLTEPQAGSDVGLLRCRAEPAEDSSYRLDGNKLFISGGEHDLTEDILHLVLARLPNAPAGTAGISLFLVPKRVGGVANGVLCDGIEHKMGIKGSATCSLRFERAKGWLLGEPHKGLAAMFVMMNGARLHVGLQGLGHAEFARQQAVAYAGERRQMRAVPRPADAVGAADPIATHPAMQRILTTLKVQSQGMRMLGFWAAHLLDVAEQGAEPVQRMEALALASVLTPLIKAYFTDQGFQLASQALQVFGGYGYCSEYPIEQTLRDSRIAMIYEGTNEIQANDLLLRKLLPAGAPGAALVASQVRNECQRGEGTTLQGPAEALAASLGEWEQALQKLRQEQTDQPQRPYEAAVDLLHATASMLLGYAWLRAARVSRERGLGDEWEDSARFFFRYLFPEAGHRMRLAMGG
ncbi:acyl-CoA dehydrogenase [Pseudomonas sp. BN515]|uniref:acyl-CoA dehydrogenase n=1 Tax=Pseudomonas sp. BN515 TaxID=2567892 RepID=UPI0024565321|nr:acyl-CoA dehydrogenase [Pseudomonas sp. BN515]MDH4871407.1 acyl-CoA dehydrogenase [Pseudomonas sp. BN515]